ncbi:hypothetical protein SAMN02745206_01731 [Desulfacinum infernum DSM 9756]|uniref:Uncharacterized protein n=1 Tax=Desulfacinum infernum DSM 9756 TaxID=1121391 RepID=A0A1M5AML3_9BACT|nr:hypothetical protein SAMN02745206_01731 [Desulfacinum infernum DSM 9756]
MSHHFVAAGLQPRGKSHRNPLKSQAGCEAYPTTGGSSAALKGCATSKEIVRDVVGQAPSPEPG